MISIDIDNLQQAGANGLFRLRAVLFVFVVGISVIFIGLTAALLFWLPLKYIWGLITGWSRFFAGCCKHLVGVTVHVQGQENLPRSGVIYYAKHQSAMETLFFQTLFPHYVWIVKQEAKRIPFFGWGLNAMKPIWIDRKSGSTAVEQICEQGAQRLDDGIGVMIFPEGTRVPAGQTRPFKMGGAILAKHANAPIVPIAHNTGSFWPAKRLLFARSGVVDVVIGEPVYPEGLSEEQITTRAEQWINQTVASLEAKVDDH